MNSKQAPTFRIAICGYGRHGKGTVAKWLQAVTGLRYPGSTSEAAAGYMFSLLRERFGYKTVKECFEDRHNHRAEWAKSIWTYNQPDGLTLYRDMLDTHDILEGVRKRGELMALRDSEIIDLVIWVDAMRRMPREPGTSCQVSADDCDVIIENNGTLLDLYRTLRRQLGKYCGQACRQRLNPERLYELLQHGDEEHRRWLLEAIYSAWDGRSVPPVVGRGCREELEALKKKLDLLQEGSRYV